jgi:hypothetical protein
MIDTNEHPANASGGPATGPRRHEAVASSVRERNTDWSRVKGAPRHAERRPEERESEKNERLDGSRTMVDKTEGESRVWHIVAHTSFPID